MTAEASQPLDAAGGEQARAAGSGRLVRLALRQVAVEQRVFWRNPAALFTVLPPIFFLALFGALGRHSHIDGMPYSDVFVPGMLGMVVVMTGFAGLAITLVVRRERGELKRMRGTPLPPSVYLGAMIASTALLLVGEGVVVLLLGHVAFGVPMPHRVDELLGVLAVGAAAFSAMGVAATVLVPNAEGSSAILSAVYLPMLVLSGAFFPVHKLPAVLRALADVLPLTHLLDALRAAFRDGHVGGSQLLGLLVVVVWAAAAVVLARRRFEWSPKGS